MHPGCWLCLSRALAAGCDSLSLCACSLNFPIYSRAPEFGVGAGWLHIVVIPRSGLLEDLLLRLLVLVWQQPFAWTTVVLRHLTASAQLQQRFQTLKFTSALWVLCVALNVRHAQFWTMWARRFRSGCYGLALGVAPVC